MDYTNNDIVACLRQYEMFANSLDMITNPKDRDNIYHQLDRLEEKLIKLTNELYEEEYVTLLNRKTSLLDEEKTRITMLIELISQRLTYIETRKNNHKLLVGHEVNYGSVLGENLLGELEERIKIIEKYTKNIKEKEEILKTLEDVNNKMTLAEEKIKINEALNRELESKMIEVLQGAFIKLKLYDYTKNSEEIEKAYKELEYSLNLARDNVKMAENGGGDILSECEEMMASVKKDYDEYKEKYNILKLMEIFNTKVRSYEDLLNKREKINDIFGNLTNTKLYELTYPEINKEYNTIKIEKQDINTYNYLLIEKNEKDAKIKEIDEENNSEKFRKVLEDLIANEKKKKQEQIKEEQRKIEEAMQKRQEVERKKQQELLKRQKQAQESRKKEMEQRIKQLLEEKEKSILSKEKLEETNPNGYSFETIKNKVNNPASERKSLTPNITSHLQEEKAISPSPINTYEAPPKENSREVPKPVFTEREEPKSDIEKELFAEFSRTSPLPKDDEPEEFWTTEETNLLASDEIPVIGNNTINKEKMATSLPNSDFDTYMKSFNEPAPKKESNAFFGSDTIFPDIPVGDLRW